MSAVGNICEPWRVFSNVAAFILTQNKTMAFWPLWHFVAWHYVRDSVGGVSLDCRSFGHA